MASEKQRFIALTALEDFWDTSSEIVFLGEWCCRYSRREFWSRLNAKVMSSPWDDVQLFEKAYKQTGEVYEKLLPVLSGYFNSIHSEKHTDRYWRILLGPWLLHFVDVVYDRYIHIQTALKSCPDFKTIGLSDSSFRIPHDTMDSVYSTMRDSYNLQIYTEILNGLGIKIPTKEIVVADTLSAGPVSTPDILFSKKIAKFAGDVICRISQAQSPVLVKDPYFPHSALLKIILKTRGKIGFSINSPKLSDLGARAEIDWEKRKGFCSLWSNQDEFKRILCNVLPGAIPISFVENYGEIRQKAMRFYPDKPEFIFSAIGWYFDEFFKMWAADRSEKGSVLIGAQHGGNYGSDADMRCEEHELEVTDYFYSWGWEKKGRRSEVRPFSANKLCGIKTMAPDNDKRGILLVTTALSRYIYRLHHFNPYDIADYLEWQKAFVNNLDPHTRSDLRVRLFTDHGWDIEKRWKDNYPDVQLENVSSSFSRSLQNCRLCVVDHQSTAFLEALSSNIPTVLFWDPAVVKLRPEAAGHYELLHKTGILCLSAEEAARTVNFCYPDVEGWWNEKERQAALKGFCAVFGRTSPTAIDDWASELNKFTNERMSVQV